MSLAVGIPGRQPSANRRVITFTTEGATFSPRLVVEPGAAAQWTDPAGAVSYGVGPLWDWGTEATRTVELRMSDWRALNTINLGYDRADGGSTDIADLASQQVSGVAGLRAATRLQRLAASYCPLVSLDVSGLSHLEQLELYYCQSLARVNLRGCVSLTRACFEDNALEALDLTSQSRLQDIRGALNAFAEVTWPAGGMPDLRHLCLGDNPQMMQQLPDLLLYQSLRELWIWYTAKTGALVPYSTQLHLNAYGNQFTSLDLSHVTACSYLSLDGSPLVSVNWGETTGFANASFNGCNMSQVLVDAALARMVTHGATSGSVDLRGCAVPSVAGIASRDTLTAAGWTVQVAT